MKKNDVNSLPITLTAAIHADPRFAQQYLSLSPQVSICTPWNEGEMPGLGKEWQYVEHPSHYVKATQVLIEFQGPKLKALEEIDAIDQEMSELRGGEVRPQSAEPKAY